MPQSDFFFNSEDLSNIARNLFQMGCVLIPDLNYSSEVPLEIQDDAALKVTLQSQRPRLFFVVSASWQRCPLVMRSVTKDGSLSFFIMQKNGGPTIDIFSPFPFQDDEDSSTLPPGFIGYHDHFFNTDTNQIEAVPIELIKIYKDITKMLRGDSRTVRLKSRTYTVTKRVLESGIKLRLPKNKAIDA